VPTLLEIPGYLRRFRFSFDTNALDSGFRYAAPE
jgi:hypothetical protein